MKALLDRLGVWVDMKFMLYQFPRNSQHVSRLPCEDVPIFLEEFDEREFLFGVQIVPYISTLGGLIQGEWDRLAECVLQLDGQLGRLGLGHNWVWVGLGQGFLQFFELCGRQQHINHLAALLVTVISTLYVPFDGDDSVWARHLQNQVGIVKNCHELGECRPPEECVVCRFEIGYLKLHALGVEVLPSPKGHGKSDLATGGCCCSEDYSMEGSLTQMQRWPGKLHLIKGIQEQDIERTPPMDEDSVELDVLDDGADNQWVPTQLWDEVRVVASAEGDGNLIPL
jgi:hypothetical protein